jgi:hypothetical protein
MNKDAWVCCDRCESKAWPGNEAFAPVAHEARAAPDLFPRLRAGVHEAWAENPPSAEIARILNSLTPLLAPLVFRGGGHVGLPPHVCPHGRSPCISTCGVELVHGKWRPMAKARRIEWYQHIYGFRPHRRDMQP